MKKNLYYIKFREISKPKVNYRGVLVEAKCERSAIFAARNNVNHNNAQWTRFNDDYEVIKCKMISKKVCDRLIHLGEIREQKEREKAMKRSRKSKDNSNRLINLLYYTAFLEEMRHRNN